MHLATLTNGQKKLSDRDSQKEYKDVPWQKQKKMYYPSEFGDFQWEPDNKIFINIPKMMEFKPLHL